MFIPPLAIKYLPVLAAQIALFWPTYPTPAHFGAQVETESCLSLTHSKCWSPYSRLKTDREEGIGLGQITRTARFDALAELKVAYPRQLAGWTWQNPYQVDMQLRAIILKDSQSWKSISWAANDRERSALMFAAYNGGLGGVNTDRRLCANTMGCDPTRWFGHIEVHSMKQRTTASGYGQSFFCVNRAYPYNIMYSRIVRYREFFNDTSAPTPPASPARLGCRV